MSIRTTRKDRLGQHARVELVEGGEPRRSSANAAIGAQSAAEPHLDAREDFLVTAGSGKVFDFSELAKGRLGDARRGSSTFTGRPQLAAELMPAIREKVLGASDVAVHAKLGALRSFWRAFDELEARSPDAPRLASTAAWRTSSPR